MTTIPDDRMLRRLVLGQLSDAEREALEVRLLDDDELFQQSQVVEDELADDWTLGRMPVADRVAFAALLERSPGLRGRVQQAEALHAVLRRRAEAGPRSWRWHLAIAAMFTSGASWRPALASGLLVAVTVGLWSRGQLHQVRREIEALRQERDLARGEEARARELWVGERREMERRVEEALAEQERLRQRAPSGGERPLSVFALVANTRSASAPVLRVPPGKGIVLLHLEVEAEPSRRDWRAVLRTEGGEQVFVRTSLRPSAASGPATVDVPVASELLTSGAYELVLEGRSSGSSWELLAAYTFEAVRR